MNGDITTEHITGAIVQNILCTGQGIEVNLSNGEANICRRNGYAKGNPQEYQSYKEFITIK